MVCTCEMCRIDEYEGGGSRRREEGRQGGRKRDEARERGREGGLRRKGVRGGGRKKWGKKESREGLRKTQGDRKTALDREGWEERKI